jgi:uncharacterized protein (TIGR02145 family)
MTGSSTVKFYPQEAGEALVTLFDMSGKSIAQIQGYLNNSLQEFRLSGLKKGLYLISVKGNSYQYSGKLLCTGQSDGTLSIEMISNNIEVIDEKPSEMERKGSWSVPFTDGNRLKYSGYSGNYGTVTTDIPTQDGKVVFNFIPCSDGFHHYSTVQIGTQIWMANNLLTSCYNDGNTITLGPVATATPAYLLPTSIPDYGGLYNWYAVNTGKLCPTGWHVPSTSVDWDKLATYVGGDNMTRGGKLKETGTGRWIYPNYAATNEFGFTARPGGYNDGYSLRGRGFTGYWWASDPIPGGSYAEYVAFTYSDGGFMKLGNQPRDNYFSVRCIKDN